MHLAHHHHSKPIFLWITLIATTALLLGVFYVETRDGVNPNSESVTFVPTDLERQYTREVTQYIEEYVQKVRELDVSKDRELWLAEAEATHNKLLTMPVPQRMQTIHLNAVLQMSQAVTALKQENAAFLSTHIAELETVLSALSYE